MPADPKSQQPAEVVVGYDGSVNATAALEWAARETASRGAHLRVVTAAPTVYVGSVSPVGLVSSVVQGAPHHLSEDALEDARRVAAKFLPDDAVTLAEVSGHPSAVLTSASTDAALLVVGNRGHGAIGSALLGSVSSAVARHAHCPVTVVRGVVLEPELRRPVTVGVDYLHPSPAAVRHAADQASRWGVPLRVVSCWARPNQGSSVLAHQTPDDVGDWALARFGMARQASADAVEVARQVDPEIVTEVVTPEAPAAPTLQEDSRRSALVVIGSRHLGPVERMITGSVGHALLDHASCPVTVVPGDAQPHQGDVRPRHGGDA